MGCFSQHRTVKTLLHAIDPKTLKISKTAPSFYYLPISHKESCVRETNSAEINVQHFTSSASTTPLYAPQLQSASQLKVLRLPLRVEPPSLFWRPYRETYACFQGRQNADTEAKCADQNKKKKEKESDDDDESEAEKKKTRVERC